MKPHDVVIPYPAQGHIAPILRLAKLLYHRGFFITFVNTEFNHNRLVRARGPKFVKGLEDFQFKTILDVLPPSDCDATQDIPLLSESLSKNCLAPFLQLINNLNDSPDCPNVSSIVSDGVTSFTLDAADHLGIPEVVFFTTSACGFWGYCHYGELVSRGYIPFKDESCFSNGYLETEIDWIPRMNGIRLRDISTFIRTTDPDAIMLKCNIVLHANVSRVKAIIINTFDDLEEDVLEAIAKDSILYTPSARSNSSKTPYTKENSTPSDQICGKKIWAISNGSTRRKMIPFRTSISARLRLSLPNRWSSLRGVSPVANTISYGSLGLI